MSKLSRLGDTFLLMVTSLNLRVASERWKNKHLHSLLFREIYRLEIVFMQIKVQVCNFKMVLDITNHAFTLKFGKIFFGTYNI